MIYNRPRRAPWWFYLVVAASCAVLMRVCAPTDPASGPLGAPHAPPSLAWFTWLITLVEALWTGVEVAGRVTLAILQYSVTIAWRAITLLGKGAVELAGYAWQGLRQGWALFRATYEHVLKPAWKFFWTWVDKTERWLERTFAPVLRWLRRVRQWVLDFYAAYVRPVLDLFDITRRALRVLASLGIDWARTLDQKLADLEEKIERPFRLLVAKINEVVNLVNRVVTLDGLFQRLAYVRTLERDYAQAWNVLTAVGSKPLTAADRKALADKNEPPTTEAIDREAFAFLATGEGPKAALFDEMLGTVLRKASAR